MALVHGLLLAAGAGRRMGRPKALVSDPDGTSWLARAVSVLDEGGCAATLVVLGASGEQAELDLPRTSWTHCPDWAKGVGHSLRHGLRVLGEGGADAALVHLVDLPDVTAAVAQRLLGGEVESRALRRAVYSGRPGHPVLIGRDHWAPLVAELDGDRGAADYLRRRDAETVECADLATGQDVDRPQA
ncbi:nucleotidyltransferase family protein [Janibacter indicus]|uniref:Nucleotidyltransferase family protein n=1 Tax=Janibacter indicus TaxID=857417 RepID=A0A7L9IZZ7_9MICO|nr:nucleotidyltransferase family protein [Janibacter indicus]QOK22971.1 nucleotidyltransferase family protein [Janibacter indicus]